MARLSLRIGNTSRTFSSLADAELVAACLSGDEHAWDALIDRYQNLIYSIPRRMGIPEADSQDIFQTVCLLLLNHLQEVREIDRLAGWLALTTRREAWRFQRRRASGPTLSSEIEEQAWRIDNATSVGPEASAPATPDAITIAALDEHLVRQGMGQLAERCRNLLTLLYCTDPPTNYADAARVLKMPLGSIGPQRARCLERLRKILVEIGF